METDSERCILDFLEGYLLIVSSCMPRIDISHRAYAQRDREATRQIPFSSRHEIFVEQRNDKFA